MILPDSPNDMPDEVDGDLYRMATSELMDRAVDDLYAFIRLMWPELPKHSGPMKPTWHVPLMCRYLEAIASGRIHRLVICIPPGFAKSLTVSVFYPAWRWLSDPARQITAFSTSADVAMRDARRTRKVLRNPKYKAVSKRALGEPLETASDQDQKKSFELTTGGTRQGYPIGGRNIGRRSDEQIIDDPHDPNDAIQRPEVARRRIRRTVERVDGTLPDRLNDQNEGPRIVIQQRIYPGDVAGTYIDRGWPHLVLPMEYDPDHPHASPDDPRTKKGELLCPKIANRNTVEDAKTKPLAAAKLQQKPEAGGEKLYTENDILTTTKSDHDLQTAPRYVLSCDPTGGGDSDDNDPSSMLVIADGPDQSVIVDVSNEADDWEPTADEADRMLARWPITHATVEGTGIGPALISHLEAEGVIVEKFKPSAHGGKYARAKVARRFVRSGQLRFKKVVRVKLSRMFDEDGRQKSVEPEDEWGEMVAQLINFPDVGHDDLVDAMSQFAIWRWLGDGQLEEKPDLPPAPTYRSGAATY